MQKDKPEQQSKSWWNGDLSNKDRKFLADRIDGLGVKIEQQESTIATLADRVARLTDHVVANKPVKIEVTCKCEGSQDGGLNAAQEAEQAAKLDAASGPLKVAVEANQPLSINKGD